MAEHDGRKFHPADEADSIAASESTGEHAQEIRRLVEAEDEWHHVAGDRVTTGDREHGAGELLRDTLCGLLELEAVTEDQPIPLCRITAQRLFLFTGCARLDMRHLNVHRIGYLPETLPCAGIPRGIVDRTGRH